MSLRKITTLLLLAAFAMTSVPAQAAEFDTTSTIPNMVANTGSAANGAVRDVVPVNITVDDITGGQLVFQTYTGDNGDSFAIAENGMLITNGATASQLRVLVITPPTGLQFVGLPGYDNGVAITLNDGGATAQSSDILVNVVGTALPTSQTPSDESAGEDTAILAKIITETASPETFGATSVPVGSIVAYFFTNQTSVDSNPVATSFSFENIGIAAPAGTSIPATVNITGLSTAGSGNVNLQQAISTVVGDTLTVATGVADADGKISVALDSTEPDVQSNSVLADLLTTAGNTVKVNTNNTTSTTANQTILYVDTDAMLIQAGETPVSTTGTPDYYDTPFNTSAFNLAGVTQSNGAALLNVALTNTTRFPNTANALITVTYSLLPLVGNGSTDATLVVDAASVSIVDGDNTNSGTGFLGALANTPLLSNSNAPDTSSFGVSVLYNGSSTTGSLPVIDYDLLDDAVTNLTAADSSRSLGFNFAAPSDPIARTTAATTPFNNNGGNLQTGIFPGVTVAQANALDTTPGSVVTAGALTPFTVVATSFAGATVGEALWVQDEVTARLLPTGGNAIFAFTGNEADDYADHDPANIRVAPTNFGTVTYDQGALLALNNGDTSISNTAIMAARLSGSSVQILPFVNRYDGVRDTIKVRPELTVTLGSTSKTQGVRVIATVSGNNIAGSQRIEVARINAAGSVDVAATVRNLPVDGSGRDSFLVENGADATEDRAAVTFASITTNGIAEAVPTSTVLDTTVPPLICGGTIGVSGGKGPNAVPNQPFARAIVVEESTPGAFDAAIVGAGDDKLRFTMPVGVDLVKISDTPTSNTNFTVVTNNGFTDFPTINGVMTIAETGSQAYIDVTVPGADAGNAANLRRSIGIAFGPKSLVVPVGTSDLTVTVTLLNNNTVLDTVGTVALADSCTNAQFTMAYCDDALSTFPSSTGPIVNNSLQSDLTSNGSKMTSFASPTTGIRVLNGTLSQARLPDLCITEAFPGALIGGDRDVTPNMFANGSLVLVADDFRFNNLDGRVLNFQTNGTLVKSDDSITTFGAFQEFDGIASVGDRDGLQIPYSGITDNADSMTTELRLVGLVVQGSSANFLPTPQDLYAFTVNGAVENVGSFFPLSFFDNGNNGVGLSAQAPGASANEDVSTFFNGDHFDAGVTAVATDLTINGGNVVFNNTNAVKLDNAITPVIKSNFVSLATLDVDTDISNAVDEIAAVTNGLAAHTQVTVFTASGDLTPGSLITVSSNLDTVTVPVNASGNFTAVLRGEEGEALTITQFPGNAQLTTLIANQNLTPTLIAAVAQNFTEIGTVTQQGTAPVLFRLTAVGRLNGDTFTPTASQLRVGGNPVYAVPGTDDMFLAIVDFRKTNGNNVIANVTGSPSVTITGMNVDFPTFSKKSRPNLVRVNERTKKDGSTRVVFKGSRLRNAGVGFLILDDGTVQEVTFRRRTRNDRAKRRVVSESSATVPTNAVFGVYHVPGRGITTLDISN